MNSLDLNLIELTDGTYWNTRYEITFQKAQNGYNF